MEHDRSGFHDVDPAARLRSIEAAAASDDQAAVPDLIAALQSDDPAERFLAIHTLERLTGQTLGYEHAAPRAERQAAAERWQSWYASGAGAGRMDTAGSEVKPQEPDLKGSSDRSPNR